MQNTSITLNNFLNQHCEEFKNGTYEFNDEEVQTIYNVVENYFTKKNLFKKHRDAEDLIQEIVEHIFEHTLPGIHLAKNKSAVINLSIYQKYNHLLNNRDHQGHEKTKSLDRAISSNVEVTYLDRLKSNYKTPSQNYSEYNEFLKSMAIHSPILGAYYYDNINMRNIARRDNKSFQSISYEIKNRLVQIQYEMLKENILSPENFHKIDTPVEIIFEENITKNKNAIDFLTTKINQGTSILQLCYRYNTSLHKLIRSPYFLKHANPTAKELFAQYGKEYELLLKNIKSRNIENPEAVLEYALNVMPNKLKHFSKMNNEYFNIISQELKTNDFMFKTMANKKYPTPQVAASNKEKKNESYVRVLEQINRFESQNSKRELLNYNQRTM